MNANLSSLVIALSIGLTAPSQSATERYSSVQQNYPKEIQQYITHDMYSEHAEPTSTLLPLGMLLAAGIVFYRDRRDYKKYKF